jgi:hypothetical protein
MGAAVRHQIGKDVGQCGSRFAIGHVRVGVWCYQCAV